MKWSHTCSLEWMKARQNYLTASDVRKLIPLTKTGRKRTITDEDRMSVWADKQRTLTLDDCMSVGAAARGHLLEPYAVDEFNIQAASKDWPISLNHWDDCVVHTIPTSSLAYSPDAMNVLQFDSSPVVTSHNADTIGEIKCYSAERHLASMCTTDKYHLEERWQIATAMAADQGIKYAYLIFFNPSIHGNNIGIFHYDRYLLRNEIDVVLSVEQDWLKFLSHITKLFSSDLMVCSDSATTETKIISEIEARKGLNP